MDIDKEIDLGLHSFCWLRVTILSWRAINCENNSRRKGYPKMSRTAQKAGTDTYRWQATNQHLGTLRCWSECPILPSPWHQSQMEHRSKDLLYPDYLKKFQILFHWMMWFLWLAHCKLTQDGSLVSRPLLPPLLKFSLTKKIFRANKLKNVAKHYSNDGCG